MDAKELRRDAAGKIRDADAIMKGAKAADDRELTADESEKVDKLMAEAKGLQEQAATLEADAQRAQQVATAVAELSEPIPSATQPDPVEQALHAVPAQAAAYDPMCGYQTPRQFLMDVMRAGQSDGRLVSDRLAPLRVVAAVGSDEQSTFSDPYGGFLIPEAMRPGLLQIEPEPDPMAGRTTMLPMAVPVVNINARVDKVHTSSVSGGLRVYRRAEADTVAASRMKIEQVTLRADPMMGIAYATEELLTDSPITFAALLAAGFRDEFTSVIIDERLNGTGVGEYLGIMNSPCIISVAKESGQDADTIVTENIKKMRARVWGYQNAIWMANQDCLPQLLSLVMAVGTGGVPIYHTSMLEDKPDVLMGRPIVYSEYLKTIGDTGDLVCANWSQYLEGIYEGLRGDESIHVRFVNNERTFRFTLRNAGAPWWRTALTPKNSTSTLSPFVKLDARA